MTKALKMPGSPPPMRGKGHSSLDRRERGRITPAYAGKSYTYSPYWSSFRDHPRLCGEKQLTAVQLFHGQGSPPPMRGKGTGCQSRSPTAGSPPPMRGKVRQCNKLVTQQRITPAYAGKSRTRNTPCRRIQDHPRLCGEKLWSMRNFDHETGSPPPMRGKDIRWLWNGGKPRITPAYAGKSEKCLLPDSLYQDHPRLCGEKCWNPRKN